MIFLKVRTVKHVWYAITGFLIMDSIFKILSPVFAIICNAVNITSIAITSIKNVSYRSIIRNINKSEATNLLENSVLEDL